MQEGANYQMVDQHDSVNLEQSFVCNHSDSDSDSLPKSDSATELICNPQSLFSASV